METEAFEKLPMCNPVKAGRECFEKLMMFVEGRFSEILKESEQQR